MRNPLNLVLRPLSFGSWIALLILAVYASIAALSFAVVVNPSLQSENSQHIAADSVTYIYMADVLREHRSDPWVYTSLATFPNTLWVPVAIAYALNSTVLTVFFNAALFWISISLFRRTAALDAIQFCLLLALNATTIISILSVNKEIVDMFALALFFWSAERRHKGTLFVALAIALLNRYEVFVAFLAFLVAITRANPWRNRRWMTVALLLLILSAALPLISSRTLAEHLEEASGGGVVTFLDWMEMHFLFFVASVPKICENFFGEFLNPAKLARYSQLDLANSWILLLNNLATAFVICILAMKRRLNRHAIRLDWMYLATIIAIVMSVSLVVQPRYFYLVYVLLCFEAARRTTHRDNAFDSVAGTGKLAHA